MWRWCILALWSLVVNFGILPVAAQHDHPSECTFPRFVQSPMTQDGDLMPWITQRLWKADGSRWITQVEHRINKNTIDSLRRNEADCSDGICISTAELYTRVCLQSQHHNKFIVRETKKQRPGVKEYKCMQFIRRSGIVVQVRTGVAWSSIDQVKCDDDSLSVDADYDWPWLGPRLTEQWIECPLIGGFDFVTTDIAKRQKLCPTQFIPSRLESECIQGEGMDFIFPTEECNPISTTKEEKIHCYASWEDEHWMYLIMSQPRQLPPKFAMTFPKTIGDATFTANLYVGAVAPIGSTGVPPRNVTHLEMSMTRTSAELCFDVNPTDCQNFKSLGMCSDPNYSEPCKKSCNLCDRAPNPAPTQNLAEDIRGQWVQQEVIENFNLNINQTHVHSPELGTFSCIGKKYEGQEYKMVSTFGNGCRPRYTCMSFKRANPNVLKYRLSKSVRSDEPLETICSFSNDPAPLNALIRSASFKNLVAAVERVPVPCGLPGKTPFDAMFKGRGASCTGHVGEYDQTTCTSNETSLWLFLDKKGDCSEPKGLDQGFTCLAHLKVPQKTSGDDTLIITEDKNRAFNQSRFRCWVLTNYTGSGPTDRKGPVLYQMPSPQCDEGTRRDVTISDTQSASYYLDLENRSNPTNQSYCKTATKVNSKGGATSISQTMISQSFVYLVLILFLRCFH
ncbi:uncharacterized protein LOC106152138 [Lingula anatina]|uniref:Uncharacterized protein LOC106152138 n=1 Tax=Lingula anatina TaxID=7574 RepID=A0A1S3H6I1_LINAN|nr:uncharacterized protein LOC106152138 [Lingula anatina]XP_013381084.1 uncharacterized protein LOC106152138 [Lingula anatina]XP_013381085.1 uncharacterized protein LOC106152138 [Lingula anatina]XP_013381086.1 uncharacterized protein LOC106152138 [Lingula anatina]|eukprot:XP_013381083.1 uncharacterized protein LOC106152138 [Lingula anatina]